MNCPMTRSATPIEYLRLVPWAALLLLLSGCPDASEPPASRVDTADRAAPDTAAEERLPEQGPPVESVPADTAPPQSAGDPPPPVADSAAAGSTPRESAAPPADAPPATTSPSEGIELFAPRNGSAATQAPVEGAYAAEQNAEPQPLFTDWPEPQAVLVLTGRQHGYIEPCGCTGLANQKGGMARRHTLLKQLAAKGWPVAPLDAGNQVRRFGRQAEIKFQMTATALRTLGYRAVGLGPDDLRLSFGELVAPILEEGPDGGSMFVSANVNLLDQMPTSRLITVGGKKIGVTTVLGKEAQQEVNAAEVELSDPVKAITAVLPRLKTAQCDLLILLAQASEAECTALAQKFPEFQLIVSADGAGEPSHDFLPIEGSQAKLIKIGAKGMHTVVVGLFDDAAQPLRYQRVPLDDRFADSPDMLKLLASYQAQLEALGLEGLGLRPVSHPRGATFVGSQVCADCHSTAYEIWEQTPHAHATDSLVNPGERTEIPRHFDPECLSCHVTGWNPQGYYPYKSGYLSLAESKHLHGNGCENCHGPGSKHVAVEMGEVAITDQEQQKLRESMRLTLEEAKKNHCMTCHDLDNSPDFHRPGAFEKYWKQVEH
jgi:hypothetical protein